MHQVQTTHQRTFINYKNFDMQMEQLSADWRSVNSTDRRIICWSKNYLRIEELSADEELCEDRNSICRSKKYSVCRSKNYLKVKGLPADQRIIRRLKIYLQIEELSADQRIICKVKYKWYVLIEEVFDLQIKKLSADQRIIPSVDWRTVYRFKNYLQIEVRSADQIIICSSKNYLQSKVFN